MPRRTIYIKKASSGSKFRTIKRGSKGTAANVSFGGNNAQNAGIAGPVGPVWFSAGSRAANTQQAGSRRKK